MISPAPLSLRVDLTRTDPLIFLVGEIDRSSISQLLTTLEELHATGRSTVFVDTREVSFADSSLVRAVATMRDRGCTVIVRRPSPRVRHVLQLVAAASALDTPRVHRSSELELIGRSGRMAQSACVTRPLMGSACSGPNEGGTP
jgi:anti-anti-sigma regulatory factor